MTRYNILFLCTGNSARSILAESIANTLYADKFTAYSAGSQPKGKVHPEALRLLQTKGHNTSELHSTSWDDFAVPSAPKMDFVFTVCDNAAGEVCPAWPGQPMTAHWGIPDPAAVEGTPAEIALAFADAYRQMAARLDVFANLPLASLDKMSLKSRLDDIGAMGHHPA